MCFASIHLSAESFQEHSPLKTHGGGHGEDQLIALGSCHHRKSDAGVARGGLDEDGLACGWYDGDDVSASKGGQCVTSIQAAYIVTSHEGDGHM